MGNSLDLDRKSSNRIIGANKNFVIESRTQKIQRKTPTVSNH